ncbi:L-fucose/L-arabinose isomerase family protein [Thermodesulfobacteriota bacterium]
MDNIKLGFVPAHREPFDESWASEMRKRCLDTFNGIDGLDIIVPDDTLTRQGCVRDDHEADKVINLFRSMEIDGLIIGTMTFGDEISALSIASAFNDLPLFLFGTEEGPFTSDGNRRSDSFCGTLSISSGLKRRKIPFIFGGILFPEKKPLIEGIRNFIRVCSIGKGFLGANVGLVGPRPERFETCIFSEDALMRKFRHRVIPVALPEIMEAALSKNNQDEIDKIAAQMRSAGDTTALNDDNILKIAGLEYALRRFTEEKKLSGMGVQCWTAMQSIFGLSPCYAMGRLTDSGIMTSCEVDIYGTLTMLLQYLASLKTTVPHFIDWTIRHQKNENMFLSWHCGNAPPSLVCENCRPVISYQSVLGVSLGVDKSMGTAEFQLKPGEVTLCRLQEHDGIFKMLVINGNIATSDDSLRGSWCWVEVHDLEKLYNTLVVEGFTHHASLIHGDYTRALSDACSYLGIETITV